MNIEDLQTICRKLKCTTEEIKWDTHLCFNVGGKMYLLVSPDETPHSASFKVSDPAFDELCEREGFIPAPYLARYKWVYVDDINRLSKKQWEHYTAEAYRLIASKLSAKFKKQLEAEV